MKSSITKSVYGKNSDGQLVDSYTLINSQGLTAKIINYGATLTELYTPDKKGEMEDIVLGFDDMVGYLNNQPYFGCTVGRVANRIAKGRFALGGKAYQLVVNNGENFLHGGLKGFDKVVWMAKTEEVKEGQSVVLSYESKDGEEGFPGNLQTKVIYTLTNNNELRIDYTATCDKITPINLTNHSYFNLTGKSSKNILNHELYVNANLYAPSNNSLIPKGTYESVKGTPWDFTLPYCIGERIKEINTNPVGYDHSFILKENKLSILAASVKEPVSGRVMEIYTSEPSIQLYTSNFLDGSLKGKGGIAYLQYQGLCLETQHLPDSINQPNFPSILLKPGETYSHTTRHRFSTY